jgi:hypothetical protein
MTFNHGTFSHDLLERLGVENVFHDRERRYPIAADLGLCPPEIAGNRDTRYPRVTLEEIVRARPELVLLPSEPYEFTGEDARFFKAQLEECLGTSIGVEMVDGSLLTWPGTRIGKAIAELTQHLLS